MEKSAKILLYPVVIESCEEGGFFANCLSLQGCHAEGESYSKVIENIEDVIKAHIEIRKKNGEFIPSVIVKDREKIDVNLPVLISS
ncbi:type II toxin-antitoxin system HicB family antitoxin [Patescibacteria group bacterium]|nr:type II toxin-antitoxin system HicB family antitoxin [Patescibacteria group bacterium]